MPLKKLWITKEMLHRNPKWLFVFGDNISGFGKKGQALVMRGEPNAVGVPTKNYPSMEEDAFFKDEDYSLAKQAIAPKFDKLEKELERGGTVVLPSGGLGTDLAQLEKRAPRIFEYIQKRLKKLEEIANGN